MRAMISRCRASIAVNPSRPLLLTPCNALTCRVSSSLNVSRCRARRPVNISEGNSPLIQHLLELLLPNGVFTLPFGLGRPITVWVIIDYRLVPVQGRFEVVDG